MFENRLRVDASRLRRFATNGARVARAIWDWYQELGQANQSEARALRLLREWLSPEQLAQYDAHHYFDVTGCHSGKRYRIYRGAGSNIQELDEAGRPRAGWCFVPRDCLAAGDVMLAQKISLETDEFAALAVARNFAPRWLAH
jgi:hypothetical protein